MARPTKFEKEFVEQGYKLAREGFTDKKIADFFNINKATLYEWKKGHTDFKEALQRAKDEFDSEDVEVSLLKRATGYKFVEVTREISPKVDPKTGKPQYRITKKVTKHVAPDVGAQCFWLKNRRADRWRDKQEIEIGEATMAFFKNIKVIE